jgi:protease I
VRHNQIIPDFSETGEAAMRRIMLTIVPAAAVLLAVSAPPVTAAESAEGKLPLEGVRVALLTGEGFQDQEALMPLAFLKNHGAQVTVVGPQTGPVKAYNSDVHLIIHAAAADVASADFDALVLPGGKAPASIRKNQYVVRLAREMFEAGKPVAAICHGPQVLVGADVVEGRTMTAYSGVADELREAGATFTDQAVVQDENLITSRLPKDIPEWLLAIQEQFAAAAEK